MAVTPLSNERLKEIEERDWLREKLTFLESMLDNQAGQLEELRAENEALKADRERLDWLASLRNSTVSIISLEGYTIMRSDLWCLRSTIDAARGEQGK